MRLAPQSKIDVPLNRSRPQSVGTLIFYQNLPVGNRGDRTEAGIARLLPRLFSSVPFPRFLLRRLIRGRATTAPRHRRTITGEKKRPLSAFSRGPEKAQCEYKERRANVLRLTSARYRHIVEVSQVSIDDCFAAFYCSVRKRLRASQKNGNILSKFPAAVLGYFTKGSQTRRLTQRNRPMSTG